MKSDMVSMGSANEKAVIYCAAVDYFKQEDNFPFSFSLTKDMLIITDSVTFWQYHPLTMPISLASTPGTGAHSEACP